MKITQILPLAACLSIFSLSHAAADPLSLGVKVGSLGIGGELSYRIDPYFSLIGSVNGFRISGSPNGRNVDFDGKLKLLTAGGSLGIHPFKNGFKILGGIFYDGNQFNLTSLLKHNVTIRGTTFTPDQVGKGNLTVHFNRVAPYLGIGFDSAFYCESSWYFFGELGVLFRGSPKANSKIKRFPLVKKYIEKQAENAADKFLLKYYPVISIGVKYSF